MTGIWEVVLPGVVYGEPDGVQIIITSPADRKSFPSSGSSRIRLGQCVFFSAAADVRRNRDILRKSWETLAPRLPVSVAAEERGSNEWGEGENREKILKKERKWTFHLLHSVCELVVQAAAEKSFTSLVSNTPGLLHTWHRTRSHVQTQVQKMTL